MNRSRYNSARRRYPGAITRSIAVALMLLTLCMSGGRVDANADAAARPTTVVLRDGVHAARGPEDANAISLGQAAFYHPFHRDLASGHGTRRTHAAVRAVLVPRDARGELDRSAAREARIDRSATRDTLVFPTLGTLTFSPEGTLSGQLRCGDKDVWRTGACLMVTAIVFDQVLMTVPDVQLTEEIELPQARFDPDLQAAEAEKAVSAPFFFYREWNPDWREFPKPEDKQGVPVHFAVRRWFSLLLLPAAQAYDPNEYPLRAYCPARIEGAEEAPLTIAVSILGGIEPYEVKTGRLPPGLRWDGKYMAITGMPQQAGRYSVEAEVKDAQFPAGDWDQARDARDTLGTPYQRLTMTFDIREPLEVELLLPSYSRRGSQASGVCSCKGGPGRAIFEGVKLPPGIQVDRESGQLHGVPTEVGNHPVEVRVTSMAGFDVAGAAQITVGRGTWRIIDALPSPGLY